MCVLEHPQRVAKSGSIFDFWLLELVPYIVEVVPKPEKQGTGASRCSDAKFHFWHLELVPYIVRVVPYWLYVLF